MSLSKINIVITTHFHAASQGTRGAGIVGAVGNDEPPLTEITLTYKDDLLDPEKKHISKGKLTILM